MRYSRLFVKTLNQVPKSVQSPSYRLLLQGGYLRTVGPGLFSLSPLGMRVIRNIRRIVHQEMEGLGGQEISVPLVNPSDLFRMSGRESMMQHDLAHFADRNNRDLVLAAAHEEAVVHLVANGVRSYRDLPVFVYQFQTKFRDEERTRCGTVRAREFVMNDAYSFHRGFADLNCFFPKVVGAYKRIFERCNVQTISAQAGVGYTLGERSYEFLMPSRCGDDHLVQCDRCGYAANEDVAVGTKETPHVVPQPIETVPVPDARSLNAASLLLEIPKGRVLKTMVFQSEDRLVVALVRGDQEVSLEKLGHAAGCRIHAQATHERLAAAGLLAPWLGPIGLHPADGSHVVTVIDDGAADSSNMLAGLNRAGEVAKCSNFGRDFDADIVADITSVPEASLCRHCGTGTLRRVRAMELGNVARVGDFYSRAMGFRMRDEQGREFYPHMGSYGIGIERLMAAIVDANRDDRGIVWPADVAPFQVFLMSIGKSAAVREMAERIYQSLGHGVLLDDRHESISHKIKDADLLGIPVRVVVSRASVDTGRVELAERGSQDPELVLEAELLAAIEDRVGALRSYV